jgi:transposase
MIGSAREHEGRKLIPIMESIGITGMGRTRKRPRTLYADTKYDMPLDRFCLVRKPILSQIKDHPGKKRNRSGRQTPFDRGEYGRIRSSVERFNAWIKAFRRVAIRYDRLPTLYMGFVHLACII